MIYVAKTSSRIAVATSSSVIDAKKPSSKVLCKAAADLRIARVPIYDIPTMRYQDCCHSFKYVSPL
jgi:hypothetical protein